jgi:PhnB protein
LYVDKVDEWFARAVQSGAKAVLPVTDMFWGDRYCQVEDPYGIKWQIATHIEDVSQEEMGRRMAAMAR